MEPEQKLAIPGHVVWRSVGNEALILDLGRGEYFGLDPVGARIWQLLGEGRPLGVIRAALLDEFEVAPDQLLHDLDELLTDLLARGLVEAS